MYYDELLSASQDLIRASNGLDYLLAMGSDSSEFKLHQVRSDLGWDPELVIDNRVRSGPT